MKTCKSGLHTYEPVKGSNIGCPECNKRMRAAQSKRWRDENPEKVRASVKAYTKKWRAANPYPDHKIAWRLGIRACDATLELIEAKRVQLKLKRLIKEMQK